jgi:hypothetical protein
MKLKIVGLLHVVSTSRDHISLKDFIDQTDGISVSLSDEDVNKLLAGCLKCDSLDVDDSKSQSIVFIAGYIVISL